MKTKANLLRLAASVGATLEEDTGLRDMRVFQMVAPDGMAWRSSGRYGSAVTDEGIAAAYVEPPSRHQTSA